MTHAVGLRTYQIFITQKGSNSFISPTDPKLKEYLGDFLKRFIAEKGGSQHVAISERNWIIQQRASSGPGESTGSISYGRYGYAASLRDVSTGIENYKKKRTDAETLQLYYRFWLPDHQNFSSLHSNPSAVSRALV